MANDAAYQKIAAGLRDAVEGRVIEHPPRQQETTDAERRAGRLLDVMLAAQSRFAQAWRDGVPLTPQQERDAAIRDQARDDLMGMLARD